MDDTVTRTPDHNCLFAVASEQHGYFTAAQARDCGFSRFLLSRHASSGRYNRATRGLYRLGNFPASPREEVVAAWLAVGKNKAVVSHESALDLHSLSDVIPDVVHLTVPRSMRHPPKLSGVKVHTTTRPLIPADVTVRDGIRVTSVPRTIVDAAEAGTGPEQIELAIRQAIQRGLTTRGRLERATSDRSDRVRALVDRALIGAAP
jgi:predicted transcriptional regulator of viral defense system